MLDSLENIEVIDNLEEAYKYLNFLKIPFRENIISSKTYERIIIFKGYVEKKYKKLEVKQQIHQKGNN